MVAPARTAPLRVAGPDVVVVGRGRVGRSLAHAARSAGLVVRLVAGRDDVTIPGAPLVLLCVPDGQVARVAERLARAARPSAVVHTAGVLPVDHLAPQRARGWSVGQAHPLAAVASPRTPVASATLLVGGDALAVRRARAFARRVAMRPLVAAQLDRALWHAVAALVANGTSALAAHGAAMLERAGVPRRAARHALVGLLASVVRNVARMGTPSSLTGPVRRGDARAVERHLSALAAADPSGEVVRLYASLATAQIGLARPLGEASEADLAAIARSARAIAATPGRRRARR
jgi:predicted short-subunit dehydrogenase-like oxidoreductase (DUF2520 family)